MKLRQEDPVVSSRELEAMEQLKELTNEELTLKRKELEREVDEFNSEFIKISDKYMKLRATKDAFLHVGSPEYKIVDEKTYKSDGKEYISLDEEFKMVGAEMNSAGDKLKLAKQDLDAVKKEIARREIALYRLQAEASYERFLELTNVKRVDEDQTFIFVTKKQLMTFWDRRSNYTIDNFAIYGMIDICDVTEEDIMSASVVSDGKNFYRGIKQNYSEKETEYWSVDYSDISLGKYMKPIQRFAVNLKELLDGASGRVPAVFYERRQILRKLVENVPTSVSAIPYDVIADNDCYELIVNAVDSAISKLYKKMKDGVTTMNDTAIDNFRAQIMNSLTDRQKQAIKKFKALC